jgi:two-component system response regulator ChvI
MDELKRVIIPGTIGHLIGSPEARRPWPHAHCNTSERRNDAETPAHAGGIVAEERRPSGRRLTTGPAIQSTSMSAGSAHVVIVEDEDGIRESVAYALERDGHRVSHHADGQRAWQAFDAGLPDLVILDIGLPGIDGLELCRRLRGRSDALPIIFLTSREEEFDRVLGLELGADDYLAKPFSIRELMARVRALLRRAALGAPTGGGQPRAATRGLSLDADRYAVSWHGQAIRATVTEFLLLQALADRPGHVKSRDQLLTAAYPHDTSASDRTIDSHVKRLRRKFQDLDPAFDAIESVYRAGYRLKPTDE